MIDCIHDWMVPGAKLTFALTIADWQGPTEAIIECAGCHDYSVLRLIHWRGVNLSLRVYAVSPVPKRAVEVFLGDMGTAYCDLSRHQSEVDALYSIAAPVIALVGVEDGCKVLRSADTASISSFPALKIRPHAEIPPGEDSEEWNRLLMRAGLKEM